MLPPYWLILWHVGDLMHFFGQSEELASQEEVVLLARGSLLHLLPEHRRLQGRLPGFKLRLPAVRRHRGQPGPDIGQRAGIRARGGVKIPAKDVDDVKAHLANYYKKMGEQPPWEQ